MLAAIGSVRAQSMPAYELIVVVDHNEELLGELTAHLEAGPASTLPVTVVANEQARGLSGGKNTGVRHATGDIVAFLDDDAVADSKWLKYLADSFSAPEITGVGGLTLPNWDTGRPAWFPREFDWVVGCNYLGMPAARQPVRNLLGGNASFRRSVFDQVGGFTVDVGRSDARLPLGCEETEFCIRLTRRSPETVLVMDHRARVFHFVPDRRCRFSYLLSRCYAEGISKALVTANVGAGAGLANERRYVTRTLPLGVLKGVADLFRGRPDGLGRAGAIIAGLAMTTAGYVAGKLKDAATKPVRLPEPQEPPLVSQ
jgi:glycosyltransferase involved in cell wall biosynthesis